MRTRSTGFLLVRGLVSGFLIAIANGLSLPILFELFILVSSILSTGKWYPLGVAELWFIQSVFGFGCSLLPSIVAGGILSLGIHFLPLRKTHINWLSTGAGMVIGTVVTVCYVFLLFYFGLLLSIRENGMLTVFILIEEMFIYGWIAHRWTLMCHPGESST